MFCPNCGTKIPDGAAFCANCGAKVPVAPVEDEPVTAAPAQPTAPAEPESAPAEPEQPVTGDYSFDQIAEQAQAEYNQTAAAPVQPEQTAQPAGEVVAPPDYMTVNIILCVVSVLSCCGCVSVASIVTSIIGIVAGSACKKAIAAGDWATAEAKSKTAKTMWIVSAVIVGLSILAGIVLMATGMLAGFMSDMNW